MTEAIIEFFRNLFNNDYLTTFFIAVLPIVELRGAVPVAIEMGMQWWQAFGLAYLGSSIVAPFLLLLLKPILELLKKIKFFNRFAGAVEGMFQDKAKSIAERAGKGNSEKKEEWIKIIGVFTFVALPIPLTGVWTGTAVAVFLGLKFRKALPAILLGNFTAGAIVTLLSVFLSKYLDTILMVFFILVLILLGFFIMKIIVRMVKSKKADKETSLKNSDSDSHTADSPHDNVVYGKNLTESDISEIEGTRINSQESIKSNKDDYNEIATEDPCDKENDAKKDD